MGDEMGDEDEQVDALSEAAPRRARAAARRRAITTNADDKPAEPRTRKKKRAKKQRTTAEQPGFVGTSFSSTEAPTTAEPANPYAPPAPTRERKRRRRKKRRRFSPARRGRRFINFTIDSSICLAISTALSLLLEEEARGEVSDFAARVVTYATMFVYYVALEATFGITIGKLVTNTMVINHEGETPSLWQVVTRTLVRFVPFDSLSFLGGLANGWHDEWTKTSVVIRPRSRA